MRTLALMLIGLICLAGGFYAGSAACQRARVAGGHVALRRASEALSVGRPDEALQYAFAAVDRDPELYGAYEVAGDAITMQQHNELPRHFYRAALGGLGKGRAAVAGAATQSSVAIERARIQAKIAALSSDP
jgi:Tfp pilus assembly protein PilF